MPYIDGSPTIEEQIESHKEIQRKFKEEKEIWDEGYHTGLEESKDEVQKLRIQLATTLISHGYPKESLEPELQKVLEE